MYFRFFSAVVLVVLVSMAGIVVEKRVLDLRRDVSRQRYQTELLLDRHSALRLRSQQLSAPERALESLRQTPLSLPQPPERELRREAVPRETRLPLLRWQRPADGESAR